MKNNNNNWKNKKINKYSQIIKLKYKIQKQITIIRNRLIKKIILMNKEKKKK